ncbi:hypothetical protein SBRCBS47491_004544 [Sporothrix bragantina]|uniref:Aldehyde dehydrogenase domain-containing protein n=1 Tax=Sporothrix bragantina TaxID=671064 RepID=A0ABP0BPF3_9PEZI
MDAALLRRVETGAIEGRARNMRGRQVQLRRLFDYLCEHRDAFVEADQQDGDVSRGEAQTIVAAVLAEIRRHYDALDLQKELAQDNRLRTGQPAPDRQHPIAIAYVLPPLHDLLFGTVTALAAAIEAGSCCVIEIPNTTRAMGAVVRDAVLGALDPEAYTVIRTHAPAAFLAQCYVVDPEQRLDASVATVGRLVSHADEPTVAIVDRTADAAQAAKDIVCSRLVFAGRSPYAVDHVLVNEFVADEFAEAVRAKVEAFYGSNAAEGVVDSVVVHADRTNALLKQKITSKKLVIVRVTSLDDAIDLANGPTPRAALYAFAANEEARYLSQHIVARATFVNYIPSKLLVGPMYPVGYPIQTEMRYTRAMFERPSPQFVSTVGDRRTIATTNSTVDPAAASKLLLRAANPLKPMGLPPAGAWGFFDQGIILGASVYLLPIFVGSVVAVVQTIRLALNKYVL